MIEFFIRLVDFSLFRQGEPVQWKQELTNLSPWENDRHDDTAKNTWAVERIVKLKMPVDEIDFIEVGAGIRCTIVRRAPNARPLELSMYTRHETKMATEVTSETP